jgi:hypothetical protein
MTDSRIQVRIQTAGDRLHIRAATETPRKIKIFASMLFKDDWSEGSKSLASFDVIYSILYVWSAGVCEQASVAERTGAKFCRA